MDTAEAPMTHQDLPLEQTLPKASYTDEGEFRRERDAVLFTSWFCVGRAEALASAGDYLTAGVAGESVIIVRGADGALRGFYNLCRHRGARLVPPEPVEPAAPEQRGALAVATAAVRTPRCWSGGAGAGGGVGATGTERGGCFDGVIRCPYHAWTYDLDGTLRSAPFLPSLRHHRKALSLHPVDVGTWGGFVFARLEPGAGDSLDAALGGIPARLARYRLADLRAGARLRYQVAANWKVIVENYNECYHCGPVHPELCELVPDFARGGADLDWDAGIAHRPGAFTFSATGRTTRSPFPDLLPSERDRHKGELMLPNLMISLSADHVAAFTVWPHSAGRTTVACDFLFHPDEIARAGFDPSDAVGFWDLVNRQDWLICERVQDGMSSRRFIAGYLAPMEQPSADVGRFVTERLGGRGGQ